MKKLVRKKATAAGIIAGTMVASSVFFAGCNEQPNVYGPPPEAEYKSEQNIVETVYGPPSDLEYEPVEFKPEENEPEDVYGPPEDFDQR